MAACPGTNACVQGVCVEPCRGGEFPCPGGYECQNFDGQKYCVPHTCNNVECPPGASCKDGACTLDNAGGAGNEAGSSSGNEAGSSSGSEAGAGTGEGGDGTGAGSGGSSGGGASGGPNGSGATVSSPGLEARGNFGLVTGGGGCACRTTPVSGGKWAALGGLLLAGVAVGRRRRGSSKGVRP
jgi:MYXO-CTERM domain-containing protein